VIISASGNSPNVLRAAGVANERGAITIAWTGESGGQLAPLADLVVRVPLSSMEQVEDAHLIIARSLYVTLRADLQHAAFADILVSSVYTESMEADLTSPS